MISVRRDGFFSSSRTIFVDVDDYEDLWGEGLELWKNDSNGGRVGMSPRRVHRWKCSGHVTK